MQPNIDADLHSNGTGTSVSDGSCNHASMTSKMRRFLEEEAEELGRLHEQHAAEAKLKREQQLERERMVSHSSFNRLSAFNASRVL